MSSSNQLSRLEEIAKKEEVVDTVQARHLREQPREVEQTYRDHLRTHLSLGDSSGTEDQLLSNLENQEGSIGIIAGKYAYGKTSTSISFWASCEDAGYVAVPPFILSSLADLMDATTGWLNHKLGDRFSNRIQQIHEKYQQKGVQQLANETGEEHDIDPDKASELIADLSESGRMNEDIPAEVLVEYYLDATELVQDAGYDGLVVFPDEVQQFFKKHSYSDAEEELRSLIWGFNPRSVPFGMMFSIPDEQLAVINERGADILDRVRENNLLLNLTSTYDHDFPKELWNHYAKKYDFEEIKDEIIPEETLTSIGQYATRDDLSRGPRTVIDAFGLAVTEYRESGSTFTPISFIEAYIDNRLRFTEPQQKVRGAVSEVEAADVVQTPNHKRAIKLMAAFPKGVTEDIVSTYGLQGEMSELSSELHGTLLTFYADGYTLVQIVKGDPDVSVGGEILKNFWREFQENDEDVADAIVAFDKHVVPKLFPEKGRGQSRTGWTVRESNQLHKHTIESYREGTFDPSYPQRSCYIRVSGRNKDLGRVESENNLDRDADLTLGLFLDHQFVTEENITEIEKDTSYQFTLNLKESLMKGDLPQRIRKLKDYMNPRSVTPLLMLALTSRIDREIAESDDNMTLAEKQSLENLRENLITETIEILFDDELRENAPNSLDIRRLRDRMAEDLFRSVMRNRYPEYKTLYKGRSITKLVGEYISALESGSLDLALTQKQGRRPVVISKDALGEAFNVKNHSSLRNKVTDKYAQLAELEWDYGDSSDEVRITFALHPLEQEILDTFPSDEAGAELTKSSAKSIASNKGYREEEFEQVLRLLQARQYLDKEGDRLVRIESTVDKEDIEQELVEVRETLETLTASSSTQEDLEEQLKITSTNLEDTAAEEEERLEEIREEVTELRRAVEEELESQFRDLKREMDDLADRASSIQRQSQSSMLNKVEIPATFSRHLNKQRTKINNRYEHISSQAEEIEERINRDLGQFDRVTPDSFEELSEKRSEEKSRIDDLQEELKDEKKYSDGYSSWRSLAGKSHDLDERVMRFTDRSGEEEFETRVNNLLSEINERFSEHGKELLLRADTYEDELAEITNDFDDRVGQQRQAFQSKKTTLENILSTAKGSHPGLRAQFSEANPQQSYENLENGFRKAIRDEILAELSDSIEELLRTANRADRFQTIPENISLDSLREDLNNAKEELESLMTEVETWSIDDQDESITTTAENIANLRENISELENEVEGLNRPVRPDSDAQIDLYNELEYGREIQLDEILEEDDQNPENLAKDLAGLFQRNLLDIKVQKRFRDLPEE
ncbi:hypothetical protein [Halovenus halobia]|uniref:hypothetical protein n=1 Tax=Halovenus halobia TaxID=3396622 RepID=UPI003F555763